MAAIYNHSLEQAVRTFLTGRLGTLSAISVPMITAGNQNVYVGDYHYGFDEISTTADVNAACAVLGFRAFNVLQTIVSLKDEVGFVAEIKDIANDSDKPNPVAGIVAPVSAVYFAVAKELGITIKLNWS